MTTIQKDPERRNLRRINVSILTSHIYLTGSAFNLSILPQPRKKGDGKYRPFDPTSQSNFCDFVPCFLSFHVTSLTTPRSLIPLHSCNGLGPTAAIPAGTTFHDHLLRNHGKCCTSSSTTTKNRDSHTRFLRMGNRTQVPPSPRNNASSPHLLCEHAANDSLQITTTMGQVHSGT